MKSGLILQCGGIIGLILSLILQDNLLYIAGIVLASTLIISGLIMVAEVKGGVK